MSIVLQLRTPIVALIGGFLLLPASALAQVTVETVQGATETADDLEQARILTVRENRRVEPPQNPTVIIVREPEPEVHIIHETHYEGSTHYYEEPEPDAYEGVVQINGWFDSLHVPGSRELLVSPEVAALDGQQAGTGQWRADTAGIMLSAAALPHPWLRIPEFRLYVGGGSVSGETVSPEGNPDLSITPDSTFVVRAEIAAGLQHTFGPISPYGIVRAGAGFNIVSLDVNHTQLGSLGSETVAVPIGEIGVEAGAHIQIEDGLHFNGAYRHSLVGTQGWGLTFGLSMLWED